MRSTRLTWRQKVMRKSLQYLTRLWRQLMLPMLQPEQGRISKKLISQMKSQELTYCLSKRRTMSSQRIKAQMKMQSEMQKHRVRTGRLRVMQQKVKASQQRMMQQLQKLRRQAMPQLRLTELRQRVTQRTLKARQRTTLRQNPKGLRRHKAQQLRLRGRTTVLQRKRQSRRMQGSARRKLRGRRAMMRVIRKRVLLRAARVPRKLRAQGRAMLLMMSPTQTRRRRQAGWTSPRAIRTLTKTRQRMRTTQRVMQTHTRTTLMRTSWTTL
mmetsp:Transcript_8110/g.24103  ORF Transcript_8110/g.24103 Transcript_8110/m.24103 type:complete len:268 (-) Transcript_8110:1726-2529(-)